MIPDREVTLSLLHRDITISMRQEIGLLRLPWLVNSSPTGHEIASILSLSGFVRPGHTFVDVGANVGLYSVLMASLGEIVGFDVVAIEPNAHAASRLRRNLSGYRCATVVEAAASNCEGRVPYSERITSGTSRVVSDAGELSRDRPAQYVECIRLDKLDQVIRADRLVFKIDVEGHETEVLEGMREALRTNRVAAVMIDGFKDKGIPSMLAVFGFRLFDGRSLRPYDGHFNLLAVHASEIGGSTAE